MKISTHNDTVKIYAIKENGEKELIKDFDWFMEANKPGIKIKRSKKVVNLFGNNDFEIYFDGIRVYSSVTK